MKNPYKLRIICINIHLAVYGSTIYIAVYYRYITSTAVYYCCYNIRQQSSQEMMVKASMDFISEILILVIYICNVIHFRSYAKQLECYCFHLVSIWTSWSILHQFILIEIDLSFINEISIRRCRNQQCIKLAGVNFPMFQISWWQMLDILFVNAYELTQMIGQLLPSYWNIHLWGGKAKGEGTGHCILALALDVIVNIEHTLKLSCEDQIHLREKNYLFWRNEVR